MLAINMEAGAFYSFIQKVTDAVPVVFVL